MALTQAVERHLPTYASLALDSRKSGSEKTCKKSNKNASLWKYNMQTFVDPLPDVSIATLGNYVDSLESGAIPFSDFL